MESKMSIESYRSRMTPDNLWPAAHSRDDAVNSFNQVTEPLSPVLRWASNGQCPMDDMLAAWLVLGLITEEQAERTSDERAASTAAFLAEYRANPPQPSVEALFEMRAAFGQGATVVDVITGQKFTV